MTSESRTDSGIHVVQYGGTPPAPAEQPEEDRPKRTWRCKRGHLYTNTDPFLLQFLNQGQLVMKTNPLCPECFRKWLENRFEMKEIVNAEDRAPLGVRPGGHRTE